MKASASGESFRQDARRLQIVKHKDAIARVAAPRLRRFNIVRRNFQGLRPFYIRAADTDAAPAQPDASPKFILGTIVGENRCAREALSADDRFLPACDRSLVKVMHQKLTQSHREALEMNKLVDHESFFLGRVERFSGAFERPVPPRASGGHLSAQFGGRLRQVFDLPNEEDSLQDRLDTLMRQIETKLG